MATLSLYQGAFLTLDNGDDFQIGSRTVPASISVDAVKYDVTKNIANTSGDNYNSQVLWATGDGGLATFDLLLFKADKEVVLELRNTASTDQYVVVVVPAGCLVALGGKVLANDAATSPIGADGSAATLYDVDQVTVKNNADGSSTAVTAKCRLVLID